MAGCAGSSHGAAPAGPERTVTRYVAAVRSGDAEAAYALLDPETRESVDFERFAALMSEHEGELEDQAKRLAERASAGVRSEARLRLGVGRSVLLVREERGWTIDSGVLDAPVLRTPRDAVLALRQALQERNLRAIERVLARDTRAELEAEIDRFLGETADELDLEYEVRGNKAVVRTSSGREVQLVREAGEWRVRDVE
jgi:hypothetical protein